MDSNKKCTLAQIEKQSLLSGKTDISLTHILSSERCQRIFSECREFREHVYKHIKTVFIFIKQVLNADKSCQKAVAGVIAGQLSTGEKPASSNTGPYCKARQRLPEETVHELVKEIGSTPINNAPSTWKPFGRDLKVFDGSTVKMADTQANQKVFPQHKNQ